MRAPKSPELLLFSPGYAIIKRNTLPEGRGGAINGNYYLLTNLLSEEETNIITSIITHLERGERRVGIQQLAAENYVSSTFIIKMCKRLGFEGYSELYYHLSRMVEDSGRTNTAARFRDLIDNYREGMEAQFCGLLSRFRERKIFTDGRGFSDIAASYLVQRLAVCGFMVFNQIHFYDFMLFHEEQDRPATNIDPSLLIAISQSGETEPVLNDVRAARQRGFRIVSFTKREDSTLAELSDLCFVVDGARQTLMGGIPNRFFGRVILAFEELMGCYLRGEGRGEPGEKGENGEKEEK